MTPVTFIIPVILDNCGYCDEMDSVTILLNFCVCFDAIQQHRQMKYLIANRF